MTTHFPLTELRDALRNDGITCVIRPGAQGKSARMFADRGYYRGCQAMCQHHTGSSGLNPAGDINYIDGKNGADPGFIISNAYTARDGTVTLIASGPTYTEGAGGPRGIIPENGGNTVCFSNEIGGGLGPAFTNPQARAAMYLGYHVTRIAARIWNWPDNPNGPNRHFAHFEWAPGRKVDPMGKSDGYDWANSYVKWNMDRFRRDVHGIIGTTPTPPGDDDMIYLDEPKRIYDSRPNEGHTGAGDGVLKARGTRVVTVPFGNDMAAVKINVTITNSGASGGFVTVTADGVSAPETSDLNWNPGEQVRNMQMDVKVGAGGKIKIHNGPSPVDHVIVDWKAYQPL